MTSAVSAESMYVDGEFINISYLGAIADVWVGLRCQSSLPLRDLQPDYRGTRQSLFIDRVVACASGVDCDVTASPESEEG